MADQNKANRSTIKSVPNMRKNITGSSDSNHSCPQRFPIVSNFESALVSKCSNDPQTMSPSFQPNKMPKESSSKNCIDKELSKKENISSQNQCVTDGVDDIEDIVSEDDELVLKSNIASSSSFKKHKILDPPPLSMSLFSCSQERRSDSQHLTDKNIKESTRKTPINSLNSEFNETIVNKPLNTYQDKHTDTKILNRDGKSINELRCNHFNRAPSSSTSSVSAAYSDSACNGTKTPTSSEDLKKHSRIVLDDDDDDNVLSLSSTMRGSYSGMMNMGNSCYMSAVLQAIVGLRDFCDEVLSPLWTSIVNLTNHEPFSLILKMSSSARASCVVQLALIAKQMYSPHTAISLLNFKAAIDIQFTRFIGHQQHDAHEFFIDLLNMIHEEMLSRLKYCVQPNEACSSPATAVVSPLPSNMSTTNLLTCDTSSTSLETDGSSSPFTKRRDFSDRFKLDECSESSPEEVIDAQPLDDDYSWLIPTHRHFFSELLTTFTCMDCGYSRDPLKEPYTNYGLDLESAGSDTNEPVSSSWSPCESSQGSISLETLLENFFSDEVRELECDKCHHIKGKVKIHKEMHVMPNTLVIHLKRFKFDLRINRSCKIHRDVSFPVNLSIARFTSPNAVIPQLSPLTGLSLPLLSTEPETINMKDIVDVERYSGPDGASLNFREQSTPLTPTKQSHEQRFNDLSSQKIIHSANSHVNEVFADENGWLCPKCDEVNALYKSRCCNCSFERLDQTVSHHHEIQSNGSRGETQRDLKRKLDDHFDEDNTPAKRALFRNEENRSDSPEPETLEGAGIRGNIDIKEALTNLISENSKRVVAFNANSYDVQKAEYTLAAIIRHIGSGTGFGHYVCDKRVNQNQSDSKSRVSSDSRRWIRCNDSYEMDISEDEVMADQRSPYILFYVKTGK